MITFLLWKVMYEKTSLETHRIAVCMIAFEIKLISVFSRLKVVQI